jgi:hypothetical protein
MDCVSGLLRGVHFSVSKEVGAAHCCALRSSSAALLFADCDVPALHAVAVATLALDQESPVIQASDTSSIRRLD